MAPVNHRCMNATLLDYGESKGGSGRKQRGRVLFGVAYSLNVLFPLVTTNCFQLFSSSRKILLTAPLQKEIIQISNIQHLRLSKSCLGEMCPANPLGLKAPRKKKSHEGPLGDVPEAWFGFCSWQPDRLRELRLFHCCCFLITHAFVPSECTEVKSNPYGKHRDISF